MISTLSFVLATSCASYTTVEEACPDKLSGEKHGTAEAIQAIGRINCYRALAGLRLMSIDREVQQAAQWQADYQALNDESTTRQTQGDPGYTGNDVFDRLEKADYGVIEVADKGIWEVYGYFGDAYEDFGVLVDYWAKEPYLRQVVLQPDQRDGGFALSDGYLDFITVYDYPPLERVGDPVIYPSYGQLDVPTTYNRPVVGVPDGIPEGVDIGYPISITLADADTRRSWTHGNPYELFFLDGWIEGPDGDVPFLYVTPDATNQPLPFSVFLYPEAPLAPQAQYTWQVLLTGAGQDEIVVDGVFTTGSIEEI